ncbi:MAG: transcriptional repressor [Butyribacter sp.]|nr:transcriptional repressor [bacterium]MDY3854057.1 transcriptional repressor [Butyribacter sp.]
MNRAKTYHTRQQKAILQFMESTNQKYITVGQIAEYLKEQGESVGLTTIYRHMDRFLKEGIVQKIVLDGNSGACYQYIGSEDEANQFLLKCEDCGSIMNMDCGHMQELYSHVLEEHHFNVNPHRTMFYGVCENCLSKEEMEQKPQKKTKQNKK